MINVDYKRVVGTLNIKCTDGKYHDFRLFDSNCLMACVNFYTNSKGEHYSNLVTFFSGETHLKNCLGLSKGYTSCLDDQTFKLNMAYQPNVDMAKLIMRALAKGKSTCKVECYYEPIVELSQEEIDKFYEGE